MSAEDVELLQRALDGDLQEQPEGGADWKKLNRKAVFKMKYKARSGKIQEILADMLQTFEDNLSDAEKKEADSLSTYEKLSGQKNSQLQAAQEAVDSLTAQVTADEGYIQQAEDSYAVKMTEWKERKRLRTEEIGSIEKAIAILTSDEARDTMSSSFKSQGNLLQVGEAEQQCRAKKAAAKLRELSQKHHDVRLAALSVSVMFRAKGHFDEVVDGIDKIISDLHKENDMDLKVKEDCENDRNSNTKMAKNSAYEIDTETALIVRKEAEIDAKNAEIARLQDEKKDLQLQRDEATVNRAKEKAEYDEAKATDEAAVGLIGKAKDALAKFYTDNSLAFAQVGQPEVEAGAAPPPPPTTWSEPYGGNKGSTNGIISLLEMTKADVEKDIKTATAEEEKAKTDYDTFKSDTEALIKSLESEKASLEGEVGDAETAVVDAKNTRKDKKKVLDDTMAFLRSIASSCDYMAVNFELRKANREAEIDGLIEAGTSLEGGVFDKSAGFLQQEC